MRPVQECDGGEMLPGSTVVGWAPREKPPGKWDSFLRVCLGSSQSPGQEGWDRGQSRGTEETTGAAPSALRLLPPCGARAHLTASREPRPLPTSFTSKCPRYCTG